MNLSLAFEKLKAKYYDPKNPTSRTVFKDPRQCMRFDFGIVEDNADPDKLGRIKVRFPMWGDAVSGWAPLVRPYASAEAGIWMLPDVDTQVICAFFNDDPSRPIALGSVYTPRAKPPVEANDDNHLKVFTTRSGSKIVLDEKDGEEKILIHTKDGKMRLVLDKAKGLSIVNEDGDISIKCKKLSVEGDDDTFITIKKDLTIKCENDTISMKAKGTFAVKSGKDVVLKASTKIKLKGSSGVTAGVKQIAKKDDMVVGVDMHDIQVPTNSGLMTIPMIPHPYVGKLADKLSNNVDVNDKAAATKGSKSKYDTPGHICMPPGVKFKSQPNNEGEVSSGTEPTVKINGKEAAVLGSMVKTCNDPQPQTCSIIAIGVPIILPIMMPGMDPDQFKKDSGTRFNSQNPVTTKAATPNQDKQPRLSNAKWSVNRATVGEEVTLTVDCSDQYENANVVFSVWKDGADMEKDQPVAKLSAPNQGGKAEAKWRYVYVHDPKNPLKAKPKFEFTAKSYRCEEKKSGSVEWGADIYVEVLNPDGKPIKNLKYLLKGSEEKEGKTGENGKIEMKSVIPGEYILEFKFNE
jgi:phage baseplate assembly protein gpV/uncharacterized Zn-binding protein involved in type VI secretion